MVRLEFYGGKFETEAIRGGPPQKEIWGARVQDESYRFAVDLAIPPETLGRFSGEPDWSKRRCQAQKYQAKGPPAQTIESNSHFLLHRLRDVLSRLPHMTNHQVPEVTPEAGAKARQPVRRAE